MEHQLVVFALGREEYGLPITQVQEIIRYAAPRTVPSAFAAVRGVINLRGKILPVCDLKRRLGLPAAGEEGKIAIVETSGGAAGLIVDEVTQVLTVDDAQVEPPPGTDAPHVRGVAKVDDRLILLLDPEQLLAELAGVALAA